MQPIDIDNVFTYHPPTGPEQVQTYQDIREGGKAFAKLIDTLAPDGPEKTLAIRKIQAAVMWANAGIACGPTDQSPRRLTEMDGQDVVVTERPGPPHPPQDPRDRQIG